ncbi:MAG: hypothetical protein QMC81_05790 [Thermoanaerobacterales bacterium]|nr:hypothetical protein [Thermoanaerobacterales bacterium]
MDQRRAPLFEALRRHRRRAVAGLHFPAHSGGRAAPSALRAPAGDLLGLDLTELPGLDDLSRPSGPIARAQALAAALYGADRTFFLVNGSTAGIQALLLAALRPGQKLLLPRHIHRSVAAGLVLSGADPVFLPPSPEPAFGLPGAPDPATLARALDGDPGIAACLAVHPTYHGLAGLTAEAAAVIHSRGLPLLVDEAHGPHLPFHPDMPPAALALGADAAVQSMHKLGGALTQASLLHMAGPRLDAGRVARTLALLQTSSPSYLLMASLDLARRQMARRGRDLVDRAVALAGVLRERLGSAEGVEVFRARSGEQDPTKVYFSLRGYGITGYRTVRLLHRTGVEVEMGDVQGVLAVVGLGTRKEDVRRLCEEVEAIAAQRRCKSGDVPVTVPPAAGPKRMTPREAWLAPQRTVALEETAGLVAAETVSISPPGYPLILPGEQVTPEMVEYIYEQKALGAPLAAEDVQLAALRVVDG